jgi:SAM-dependent methyltransferase
VTESDAMGAAGAPLAPSASNTTGASPAANAEQIEYWNAVGGPKWVRYQEMLDRQLDEVGEAAMDAAGLVDDETVLDVGCGCGSTTLTLARRVGAAGRAVGIDISRPMIDVARARAAAAGLAQAVFEVADAQVHPFTPSFDAVFSRFGVMFFEDPVAAFTNLRRALRREGRLAFVCWRGIEHNPWMAMPLMAAVARLGIELPANPGAPGPFAFADPSRVEGILSGAGFRDGALRALDIDLTIGGGGTLEETVQFALDLGPLGRLLANEDEARRADATEAVREALAAHAGEDGVRMPGSVWIVTARA